jgi:hypothetical protein
MQRLLLALFLSTFFLFTTHAESQTITSKLSARDLYCPDPFERCFNVWPGESVTVANVPQRPTPPPPNCTEGYCCDTPGPTTMSGFEANYGTVSYDGTVVIYHRISSRYGTDRDVGTVSFYSTETVCCNDTCDYYSGSSVGALFWVAAPSAYSVTGLWPFPVGRIEFTTSYNDTSPPKSAPVEFTLYSASGSAKPQISTQSYPATHDYFQFFRPKIDKGLYTSMGIRWLTSPASVDEDRHPQLPDPFNVLGKIYYTQYNTPDESVCKGSTEDAWLVTTPTSCDFQKVALNGQFIKQTVLNGTGRSSQYGLLHTSVNTAVVKKCADKFPAGATTDNTFIRVYYVIGSCGTYMYPDSAAAVAKNSGLPCGTQLSLVKNDNSDFAGRVVQDLCPICKLFPKGTEGHIDSYSSAIYCSSDEVGSLGTYWTSAR